MEQKIDLNPTLTIALKDGGAASTTGTPHAHPGIFKIYRPVIHGESMASATVSTVNSIKYIANGTHVIGKGVFRNSISSYINSTSLKLQNGTKSIGYSFLIEADGARNFLQINRVPKFAKSGYARWGFDAYDGPEDDYTKTYADNNDTEILSDWGTGVRHANTATGTDIDFTTNSWNINNVKVSVEGKNVVGEFDTATYPEFNGLDANIYTQVIVTVTGIDGTFGKDNLTMELNLRNFLSTYTI